jgi:Helix-turn-helix domain
MHANSGLKEKEKGASRRAILARSDPEYIRPADAPRFGISRSTAYNWIADGILKSKVVRRLGNMRGVRLISVESLRELIENGPEK